MIEPSALHRLQKFDADISHLTRHEIERLIDKKKSYPIIEDERLKQWADDQYRCFFAPFDWINHDADIVMIGITPGMNQASQALATFVECRRSKASIESAAKQAKDRASFAGSMREISALLMDRFRLNALFGLKTSADLFGVAARRAHYTSILRYPVVQRTQFGAPWKDFGGGDVVLRHARMAEMIESHFLPEIRLLPNAWLVPFGPTPASVLDKLARDGLIDPQRILPGMNHPSGTQWNRHKCQLKLSGESHADCASNVGCAQLQGRTSRLQTIVATRLQERQKIPT